MLKAGERELVEGQLARLVGHRIFIKKERLRDFLAFVVNHTLDGDLSGLKEVVIGAEVYKRDPSYDPKESPIVRTEARRLRALLEEYYATDGAQDPVVIRIPKGAYVADFEFRDAPAPLPATFIRPLPAPRGWSPAWRWLTLAGASLVLVVVSLAMFTSHHVLSADGRWSARPFSTLEGSESFTAFSPDGQRLAFVWSNAKDPDGHVYVQDLDKDAPVKLTAEVGKESRPAWSPDGRQIAFLRVREGAPKEVRIASLTTGQETKIADLDGSDPWLCSIPRLSWSSDGQTLYTSEALAPGEPCGIVAINIRSRDIRRITQPPAGTVGDLEAAVSPDGRQLAFLRNAATLSGDIYVASIGGGPAHRVTFDNRDIMGFCWSADGQGLIVASRRGDGVVKLWRMSLDGREAQQLTDGIAVAAFPSAAPSQERIAFTSYRNVTSIWRAGEEGDVPVITGQSGNSTPVLSPDGKRLAYRSDRTGAFELWISDRDGGNSRRLTYFKGAMANDPAWSPDGTMIVFECRSLGHSDICVVPADGSGNAQRVTRWSSNQILPSWSRDGRCIYFTSNYSGRWEIYKQAISGGEPVAVTRSGGMRAVESWDGRFLYIHRGEPLGGIVRIPTGGDTSKGKVFLSELTGGRWGDWGVGPQGLIFLEQDAAGAASIVAFNPDTGTRRKLAKLSGRSPEGDLVFSVAPDGKSFLYVKTEVSTADIGMLERRR